MTTADLAGQLGLASRKLAEAIDALTKCVTAGDALAQMERIEKLRAHRDAIATKYRAAATAKEEV